MRLFLLTSLAMLAFAANSILNRLALTDASGTGPASFALIRLVSGAAVLGGLAALRGGFRPRLRPVAAASLALYVLGFSFAYLSLAAGAGALILFGTVQITMFAGAVAAREPIPAARWLGAGVAFAGLVWLVAPGARGAPDLGGAVLMAAAGLGWGIYSLAGRAAPDPLAATAANFLWALPAGLAVWLIAGGPLSPFGAVLAVISGAVTSGLGYALWYAVLPGLGASRAAVTQLTVPVLAMAGGMALLGEPLTLRFVLSAALVLGGVAISLIRPDTRR